MRGSSLRQTLLTNNLANADTPGYQRRTSTSTRAAARDGGRRSPPRPSTSSPTTTPGAAVRPDGSGVDIDQESAELAEERARVPGARTGRRRPQRDHPLRDGGPLMGLFDAIDIAGSGLTAERMRMDVTAENLANAQTRRRARTASPTSRQRGRARRRRAGRRASAGRSPARCRHRGGGQPAGGVQVAGIVEDPTPAAPRLRPGNPEADAQGYVHVPNVNPVTEMVDLISESRSPTRPT